MSKDNIMENERLWVWNPDTLMIELAEPGFDKGGSYEEARDYGLTMLIEEMNTILYRLGRIRDSLGTI